MKLIGRLVSTACDLLAHRRASRHSNDRFKTQFRAAATSDDVVRSTHSIANDSSRRGLANE